VNAVLNTSRSLTMNVCVSWCVGSGKYFQYVSDVWIVTASFSVFADAPRALRNLLSLMNRYWNLCDAFSW